jgi:hypothetical protein
LHEELEMLTPPPVNAGSPRSGIEPIRSVQARRVLTLHLLTTVGGLIDVAEGALGSTTADVAEWLGTTLIRWAEQDRAEVRERLNATGVSVAKVS